MIYSNILQPLNYQSYNISIHRFISFAFDVFYRKLLNHINCALTTIRTSKEIYSIKRLKITPIALIVNVNYIEKHCILQTISLIYNIMSSIVLYFHMIFFLFFTCPVHMDYFIDNSYNDQNDRKSEVNPTPNSGCH